MADIHWKSAAELARAYRSSSLSPVKVVESLLERAYELNTRINAYLYIDAEHALASAHKAAKELAQGQDLGPLHGIPYGVKDIIDVKGLPMTCHSEVLKDNVAQGDAAVVSKLRSAGAIVMGKLATHEFAIGGPAFDLPFPPARNPWNTDHHPGGSSSGSGAGVAAGLFPVALGTDTGGSIRNPAGACGVMGLKPTYDKVSRQGVFPLSWSLDHVGPLARKVEDLALFMQAMADGQPIAISPDIKGLRIGFVRHYHESDMQATPQTCAALETAAQTFAGLGAKVSEVRLPRLSDMATVNRIILTSEAWTIHGPWLRRHPEKYCQASRRRLMVGAFVTAEEYQQAQMMATTLCKQVDAIFDEVDVLLLANSMHPACRFDDEQGIARNYMQHARAPFNLTGHPAMSMMCGLSEDGLPIGMQIASAKNREDLILSVALAFQNATTWSDQHPALPI